MSQSEWTCCHTITIIVGILFIIGLALFTSGCNSKLQTTCPDYNIVDSKITQHKLHNLTCKKCVEEKQRCTPVANRFSCTIYCSKYQNYDCYSLEIEFTYGNEKCDKNIYNLVEFIPKSNYLLDYPIGKNVILYVSKDDNKCEFNDSTLKNLSIAGLIFLLLGGTVLLIRIFWYVSIYYNAKNQEIRDNHHPDNNLSISNCDNRLSNIV